MLQGVVAITAFLVVLAAGYMSVAKNDIAMSREIIAQFRKRGGRSSVTGPAVVG